MIENIHCDVIRDLLPLYKDDVCSDESRKLVENHLNICEACSRELEDMSNELEIKIEENLDTNLIKKISKSLKKDKRAAFENGVLITLFCAIVINIISYNLIGTTILDDGTLQEPFFLIPLSYLFALIGIIMVLVKYFKKYKGEK